tara:strand:- start:227 stop:709 length:483 start_codon:yes stop_codon:yes gene_type:complete
MGGGILPVTIHENNIYFLFSREYINSKKDGGKWSDFGGSKEKNETYYDTAIREGFEESGGFLGSKKDLVKLVKTQFIKTVTLADGWRTYIVYIPYDSELPERFRDDFLKMELTHPEKICKKGLYEKDMLKWVNFNDLSKFNKDVRPWYKKVVKLLIKYGL